MQFEMTWSNLFPMEEHYDVLNRMEMWKESLRRMCIKEIHCPKCVQRGIHRLLMK